MEEGLEITRRDIGAKIGEGDEYALELAEALEGNDTVSKANLERLLAALRLRNLIEGDCSVSKTAE